MFFYFSEDKTICKWKLYGEIEIWLENLMSHVNKATTSIRLKLRKMLKKKSSIFEDQSRPLISTTPAQPVALPKNYR